MSGEPILSQEPFIMIITFQMSLILPKLIVWHDNEIVAEVLKRLEENDLYVKPEKYS